MAETRTIRTVLELNAQRFNRGAASAAASAKTLSGELARIGDSNGQFRAEYDRVGNSLLGMGAAAAAGLGLATKASMDWESAWAGVLKTVDGSDAELAQIEDGLRGLAQELPATHAEIAGVAEAAGQLGVETGSIVEFTETMINLGETTNLSAEEAATGLARFSNVMGTSQDEVDNLGAALVGLGNNFETTESEILAMSMRLSGIGAQMDLTEGDVLGLATAMSSVGIEAEAGGTAMTMGMKKIDKAVREGGDALAGFAEVAGMSNEEFAKLWSEDSAAGLEAFVHGLSDVSDAGGDVAGTLDELGIKGIRESDTFLRLASNAEGLSEALEAGNTEFERNLALTEEAAKKYETTESQLQIARNSLVDAGIDIGAQVLPVLADVAGHVADLAGWFSELPDPVQSSVVQLGAAAGASALLAGGLMKAVPAAMDTVQAFKRIRTEAPRTGQALGKVAGFAGRAAGAFVALQVAGAVADQFREASTTAEEMAAGFLNAAETGEITKGTLDEMFAATGTGNAEVRDLAHALEILDAGAVAKAGDFLASGLGVWDTQTEVATKQVEELDRALGSLWTSGNVEQVAAVFAESGVPVEDLIENLPILKTELTGVATEMGLEADAATLAAIATGEIVPEAEDAAGAVDEFGNATGDATGEVEDQVDALDELQDRLKTTSDLLLGTRGSELDFLDSIDAATDALDENGKVLDENGNLLNEMDEDARASRRALDGIAESTHAWIDALPDGATAEELDAVMERGREQFIKSAEDMGMSEEAAADLADQLGLMPEFVETEVKVETEEAKKEWDALWDEIGYHPPEVPVDADTDPAEQSIGNLMHQEPVDVPVGADTDPAEESVGEFKNYTGDQVAMLDLDADAFEARREQEAFLTEVNLSHGTVDINGETLNADEALDTIIGLINESDGTVTINGNDYPADQVLAAALTHINSSGGTVDIYGDSSDAESKGDHAARDRSSTVTASANTGTAERELNHASRNRSATIYTSIRTTGSALVGSSRAGGGWLNSGLAGGGWVPGNYPGPGVDNVAWPVASGRAGGGMLTQPLAGTEYVVNGQSAQQWGPALEAINSGMGPQDIASAVSSSIPSGPATLTLDGAALGALANAVRTGASQATIAMSDRVAASNYQRGQSASRAMGAR